MPGQRRAETGARRLAWQSLLSLLVRRASRSSGIAEQRGANALRAIFAERRSAIPESLNLALTSQRQQLTEQPRPTLRHETRTERNKARRISKPLRF